MTAIFEYASIPAFALSWIIHIVVATVWYSKPFFGETCGVLAFGRIAPRKAKPKTNSTSLLGGAMACMFFSFLLGVIGCQTAFEGALWGLAFGLFFDSGMNASHSFFEQRPFELFLIHRGCNAVSLTLVGAVLGACCGGAIM